MLPMPIADFAAISRELAQSGRRVHVMWQTPESLAFVARGREYRSEFHINPSDEVMYMIKGEMNLQAHKEISSAVVAKIMGMLPTQNYDSIQLIVTSGGN